jgi:transcriptional regulator of acetoin/glycerol metabolism
MTASLPPRLTAARDEFLQRGRLARGVPGPISSSWLRSRRAGVDADAADVPFSDPAEDSPLVWAAGPPLRVLRDQLGELPVGVVLADERGRVQMRTVGSRTAMAALDLIQLAPGADFGEHSVGTNGIGTVAVTGRPTFVQAGAHYRGAFLDYACAGAPIMDPVGGRVLGVLDLTARQRDSHPRMRQLAERTATLIADRLRATGAGAALRPATPEASSLWQPALHDTIHALRHGQSLLMLGEPGSGRLTLLADALQRVAPGAPMSVLRAGRVREGLSQLTAEDAHQHSAVVFADAQLLRTDELATVHRFLATPGFGGRLHRPVLTAAPPVLRDASPLRALLPYVAHTVMLPALRQRRGEFAAIVRTVADRIVPGGGGRIERQVVDRLAAASWPDNIDELAAVVKELLERQPGGAVAEVPPDLVPRLRRFTEIELAERREIAAAIAWTNGNRTASARLLGISRAALYRKLAAYGLPAGRAPS